MQETPVIFYADDDQDDIFVFTEAAEDIDAHVEVFLMGESMLDAMYNPPPQPTIVFVDLNMPEKSGYELIREIKSSPFFKDIPVVVLSTANDHKTITLAKRTGADYFITKPNSLPELKKAVKHTLDIDWKNNKPTTAGFHYNKSVGSAR
ncbi:MAG TPA: response regulator [Flavobacterium sp.]|jgi:CheY-like chemotaxis protein